MFFPIFSLWGDRGASLVLSFLPIPLSGLASQFLCLHIIYFYFPVQNHNIEPVHIYNTFIHPDKADVEITCNRLTICHVFLSTSTCTDFSSCHKSWKGVLTLLFPYRYRKQSTKRLSNFPKITQSRRQS